MELKDYKIAWFTEGGWTGKVSLDNPNMRNDVSTMYILGAEHYPIFQIPDVLRQFGEEHFDFAIVTLPKTNVDKFRLNQLWKNSPEALELVAAGVVSYDKSTGNLTVSGEVFATLTPGESVVIPISSNNANTAVQIHDANYSNGSREATVNVMIAGT